MKDVKLASLCDLPVFFQSAHLVQIVLFKLLCPDFSSCCIYKLFGSAIMPFDTIKTLLMFSPQLYLINILKFKV